ncbi:hypothetical protein EMIT0194P_20465 [Pseudomonas serbica]
MGYVYTPPPTEWLPGEACDPLLAFCYDQRPRVCKMQAQVDIRTSALSEGQRWKRRDG